MLLPDFSTQLVLFQTFRETTTQDKPIKLGWTKTALHRRNSGMDLAGIIYQV